MYQIIASYTFNLHNSICQLFLNKDGKKENGLLIKSKENLKHYFTKISERLKIQVYLLWRLKLYVAQLGVQMGRRTGALSYVPACSTKKRHGSLLPKPSLSYSDIGKKDSKT